MHVADLTPAIKSHSTDRLKSNVHGHAIGTTAPHRADLSLSPRTEQTPALEAPFADHVHNMAEKNTERSPESHDPRRTMARLTTSVSPMPDDYFIDLPSAPTESIAGAAARLGVNRISATEIAHSGLAEREIGDHDLQFPATFRTLRGPVFLEPALAKLASRSWVDLSEPHRPAVNVRVRAARRVDDEDREVMGWHTSLSTAQLDIAVARWWQKPRRDVSGFTFVATLAGFVVATGRITGVETKYGSVAYEVDWNDPEASTFWGQKRFKTPPGGNAIYID